MPTFSAPSMSEELIREVLRRQDAFSEEYTQLVEFLGEKFDAVDRRFEAVDRRFVGIEVDLEGVHDQIKILAEGVTGTNQRLDRFLHRLERLEAG